MKFDSLRIVTTTSIADEDGLLRHNHSFY